MKKKHRALLPWIALSMAAASAFADAPSATVNAVTYLDENASVIWRTITSPSSVKIALDWPARAASAVLTKKIGKGAAQTATLDDTSATSYTLAFETPQSVAAREVVTLSISYRDTSDAVLSSQTVRLGLVDGIGNGASVATPLSSGGGWARFDGHRVVQIPPDATSVELDGVAVDCDIPGWHDLAPSVGTHTLACETAEGTSSATVARANGGFVIFVK